MRQSFKKLSGDNGVIYHKNQKKYFFTVGTMVDFTNL